MNEEPPEEKIRHGRIHLFPPQMIVSPLAGRGARATSLVESSGTSSVKLTEDVLRESVLYFQ